MFYFFLSNVFMIYTLCHFRYFFRVPFSILNITVLSVNLVKSKCCILLFKRIEREQVAVGRNVEYLGIINFVICQCRVSLARFFSKQINWNRMSTWKFIWYQNFHPGFFSVYECTWIIIELKSFFINYFFFNVWDRDV